MSNDPEQILRASMQDFGESRSSSRSSHRAERTSHTSSKYDNPQHCSSGGSHNWESLMGISDHRSAYRDGGSIRAAAQELKHMGRYGDTDVVHVNEKEKRVLKAMGGRGTVNPKTGLREYMDDGPHVPLKLSAKLQKRQEKRQAQMQAQMQAQRDQRSKEAIKNQEKYNEKKSVIAEMKENMGGDKDRFLQEKHEKTLAKYNSLYFKDSRTPEEDENMGTLGAKLGDGSQEALKRRQKKIEEGGALPKKISPFSKGPNDGLPDLGQRLHSACFPLSVYQHINDPEFKNHEDFSTKARKISENSKNEKGMFDSTKVPSETIKELYSDPEDAKSAIEGLKHAGYMPSDLEKFGLKGDTYYHKDYEELEKPAQSNNQNYSEQLKDFQSDISHKKQQEEERKTLRSELEYDTTNPQYKWNNPIQLPKRYKQRGTRDDKINVFVPDNIEEALIRSRLNKEPAIGNKMIKDDMTTVSPHKGKSDQNNNPETINHSVNFRNYSPQRARTKIKYEDKDKQPVYSTIWEGNHSPGTGTDSLYKKRAISPNGGIYDHSTYKQYLAEKNLAGKNLKNSSKKTKDILAPTQIGNWSDIRSVTTNIRPLNDKN